MGNNLYLQRIPRRHIQRWISPTITQLLIFYIVACLECEGFPPLCNACSRVCWQVESPLPEQFSSTYENGKWVTVPVLHSAG